MTRCTFWANCECCDQLIDKINIEYLKFNFIRKLSAASAVHEVVAVSCVPHENTTLFGF